MPRLSHTQALLEPELFSKVRDTPVLVVGAGGIGCELCEWSDTRSKVVETWTCTLRLLLVTEPELSIG